MKLVLDNYYGGKGIVINRIKILARSTNSFVYLAERKENGKAVRCVMKELFPQKLQEQKYIRHSLLGKVKRSRIGDSVSEWGMFEHRFVMTAQRQMLFCKDHQKQTSTVVLHGLYSGNGTVYTVSERFDGISWDKMRDVSLLETVTRGKALTRAVGEWHKDSHDYLLIDIKEANVLIPSNEQGVLDESSNNVILCDFDSVVTKSELDSCQLRFSSETAAPELLKQERKSICQATDVYSIAATIFKRLTGYSYQVGTDFSKCFNRYPLKITDVLVSFFTSALSAELEHRIPTCADLYDALTNLKKHLNTVRTVSE